MVWCGVVWCGVVWCGVECISNFQVWSGQSPPCMPVVAWCCQSGDAVICLLSLRYLLQTKDPLAPGPGRGLTRRKIMSQYPPTSHRSGVLHRLDSIYYITIYHVIGPKNRFAVLMDILTVRRPRLKIYFIMHCNIWLWRYPWSCWDLCPDSTNTLQELCSLLIIEHSMISHCFIVRHQVKSWPISLFQSLQRNLFQY